MEQDFPAGQIAVYLHNPFCLSICPYCSFIRFPWRKQTQERYYELLNVELDLWERHFGRGIRAKTVYFGGGTPSLMRTEWISALCARLGNGSFETTLEINPIQVTPAFLEQLSDIPVNRISLGVQSMNDVALRHLGRRHKAADVSRAIRLLRDNGHHNISLDLIYGLPWLDEEDFRAGLDAFISLQPEHLSCYLLTLEEGTPLYVAIKNGQSPPLPDEDLACHQYYHIVDTLKSAGFEHYEISNFARPGFQGLHNLSYWRQKPYLGLGVSASGWLPPWRYQNPCDLEGYEMQLRQGLVMQEADALDEDDILKDTLMMGLRLMAGISYQELDERFPFWNTKLRWQKIVKLQELNLLDRWEHGLRLAAEGLFVSNSVIGEILWP